MLCKTCFFFISETINRIIMTGTLTLFTWAKVVLARGLSYPTELIFTAFFLSVSKGKTSQCLPEKILSHPPGISAIKRVRHFVPCETLQLPFTML